MRIASSRLSGRIAGTAAGVGTEFVGAEASGSITFFPWPSPPTAGRPFDAEALPHLDALYRVALRLTGDPTQAEDLVQDTMLKAYRSWRQYRPGTNAKGWLLTILRNTFINDYRRRKLEPVATDLEAVEPHAIYRAVEEVDPEGAFFSQIVDEKVLEAVDALPPGVPRSAGAERHGGHELRRDRRGAARAGRHGQIAAVPRPAGCCRRPAVQLRGRDRHHRPRENPDE